MDKTNIYLVVPNEYKCVYDTLLSKMANLGEDLLKDCNSFCEDKNVLVINCWNMFQTALASYEIKDYKKANLIVNYIINQMCLKCDVVKIEDVEVLPAPKIVDSASNEVSVCKNEMPDYFSIKCINSEDYLKFYDKGYTYEVVTNHLGKNFKHPISSMDFLLKVLYSTYYIKECFTQNKKLRFHINIYDTDGTTIKAVSNEVVYDWCEDIIDNINLVDYNTEKTIVDITHKTKNVYGIIKNIYSLEKFKGKGYNLEIHETIDGKYNNKQVVELDDILNNNLLSFGISPDLITENKESLTVYVVLKDSKGNTKVISNNVIYNCYICNNKNTPIGKNIVVKMGDVIEAKQGIDNINDLSCNPTFVFKNTVDNNFIGTQPTIVEVIYEDGSIDEVPINITIEDYTNEDYIFESDTYFINANPKEDTITNVNIISKKGKIDVFYDEVETEETPQFAQIIKTPHGIDVRVGKRCGLLGEESEIEQRTKPRKGVITLKQKESNKLIKINISQSFCIYDCEPNWVRFPTKDYCEDNKVKKCYKDLNRCENEYRYENSDDLCKYPIEFIVKGDIPSVFYENINIVDFLNYGDKLRDYQTFDLKIPNGVIYHGKLYRRSIVSPQFDNFDLDTIIDLKEIQKIQVVVTWFRVPDVEKPSFDIELVKENNLDVLKIVDITPNVVCDRRYEWDTTTTDCYTLIKPDDDVDNTKRIIQCNNDSGNDCLELKVHATLFSKGWDAVGGFSHGVSRSFNYSCSPEWTPTGEEDYDDCVKKVKVEDINPHTNKGTKWITTDEPCPIEADIIDTLVRWRCPSPTDTITIEPSHCFNLVDVGYSSAEFKTANIVCSSCAPSDGCEEATITIKRNGVSDWVRKVSLNCNKEGVPIRVVKVNYCDSFYENGVPITTYYCKDSPDNKIVVGSTLYTNIFYNKRAANVMFVGVPSDTNAPLIGSNHPNVGNYPNNQRYVGFYYTNNDGVIKEFIGEECKPDPNIFNFVKTVIAGDECASY